MNHLLKRRNPMSFEIIIHVYVLVIRSVFPEITRLEHDNHNQI